MEISTVFGKAVCIGDQLYDSSSFLQTRGSFKLGIELLRRKGLMATFFETVTLEKQTCCECGITFAAPDHFFNKRREDGREFRCPNGHTLHWGDTTVKRLQRELDAQKAETNRQRENYFREQREREALEKKAKLAAKRSSAGTCPCCKRTFSQMARHMKTKHPDYPVKP